DPPSYPFLWQCVGMIVGVYGIGYLAASRDPIRHWPIVLVGMLGKILGPIGFIQTALAGDIAWSFGIMIIFNDLVWWIPFGGILALAWKTRGGVIGVRA
ncbi:MAG: alkyl hydroperoxide reductase, partial [Planctomycetota bacterium]|nr:alkyl hydroperoxide reductase [Planctomycetota bacterium]